MATQTASVTRAPANGASQSTGVPAAGAVDYSLTDLDLLDAPAEGAADAEDTGQALPASGQALPASGQGTAGNAGETSDAVRQPNEDAEDRLKAGPTAEFERAFELPDIGPKLREICERDAQFREIFTDAASARTAATAQADLARLDRMVASRDPRVHAELLAGIQRISPPAFRELAFTFAHQLAVLDPEAYRQVSAAMAAPASTRPGVGGSRPSVPSPAPAAAALQPQAAPQMDPAPAASANQFLATVNAGVEQAVHSSISAKVAELLPDAPEGARQKISGEIFRELDATLRQDPELLDQVRESILGAMRSGAPLAANAQPADRVAQFIAGRARAALPAVAKRVVADWSETVLRSSHARRARQSESASRVEVGRGGSPGPVPLRARGVDYGRMSDEEILNME